ncbi:hypothetical protein [Desulfosporosinus sp. Sb-LF]|uniref:hypothetical protein n=1 Tax=Desulfosporosinus sp. Sb-LF TaxID=2560027 RepID=UPI00107F14E4|nr:hypothetical protein [Desulfosporosinus sp. Sb-LF]TGE30935.1 hypothetical protein E4K68_20055 [Desulfosporosinus sp. Sb-LF]
MGKFYELVKFIKNPHKGKIQQIKEKYLELDDLSNVALEIGNAAAYKSLQTELKEVFFDYLSAVVVDSVYKLVPHVLIIWVISLKWQVVTVPVVNWQFNILGAYLLLYLIFNVGQLLVNPIRSGLSKLGLTFLSRSSVINKL